MSFPTIAAISQTVTSTAASIDHIDKPTGLAVGDLMIAGVVSHCPTPPGGLVVPAGWTTLRSYTSGSDEFYFGYRIADAADVAASSFAFSAGGTGATTNSGAGFIARIPAGEFDAADPFNGIGTIANGTGTAISASGITPAERQSLIIGFFGDIDNTDNNFTSPAVATTNPSSWSQSNAVGQDTGDYAEVGLAYANYLANPGTATGNFTMTISASANLWVGFIVAVKPPRVTVPSPLTSTVTIGAVGTIVRVAVGVVSSTVTIGTVIGTVIEKTWTFTTKTATDWIFGSKS